MAETGNRCELKSCEKEGHGFFNYGRAGSFMFEDTTAAMHGFLAGCGYVSGRDGVARFIR